MLNEGITTEIDTMMTSLESAKEEFKKKFESLTDEMLDNAWSRFTDFIEIDSRYSFDRWIRETCNEIVGGLLAGETKWLKHQHIISEYSYDRVQKIRLAIWNAAKEGITDSLVNALQAEIGELHKQISYLRR
jgi:hypothetical protein